MPMQSTTADNTPARDASVRERPILFSGPMVRAILDGSKTQTRRVVIPQPSAEVTDVIRNGHEFVAAYPNRSAIRPYVYAARPRYGQPGDRLWVRESFRDTIEPPDWASADFDDEAAPLTYRHVRFEATPRLGMRFQSPGVLVQAVTYLHESTPIESDDAWARMQRRPSIHMPRWACRLVLELTDVRVERVQTISDADAEAEGLTKRSHWWDVGAAWEGDGIAEHPVDTYRTLWDSLNAKRGYGWSVNPWVWVLSFRRVDA